MLSLGRGDRDPPRHWRDPKAEGTVKTAYDLAREFWQRFEPSTSRRKDHPYLLPRARPRRRPYGLASMRLYFAYGANLNRAHMGERCPTAEPIGPAVLPEYRLVFRRVADLEPIRGEFAVGVLWQIRHTDEVALDRYEGYPIVYGKATRTVYMPDDQTAEAMLYLMNRGGHAPPAADYLQGIRQGYRDFELPEALLDAAVARARRPGLRRFRPPVRPRSSQGT